MVGATRRVLVSQSSRVMGDKTRLSCNLDHLLGVIHKW